MKRIFGFSVCGLLAVLFPAIAATRVEAQTSGQGGPTARATDRAPVLVELFTSEGCPHCPEADALLERLYTWQSIEGAQIVALEEHVDYWDRPVWVDHFSSPAYTARQQSYSDAMELQSLYTPQMVVDGVVEFVGNNERRARATISALGRAPKAVMHILPVNSRAGGAKSPPGANVQLEVQGLTLSAPAAVYLVLAEDKLYSRVSGGKNSGETWPHSSIARWFHLEGKLSPGDTNFSASVALDAPLPNWRMENLRLITFVQEAESRRVVALGTARLADFMSEVQGAGQPAVERASPDPPGAAPKMAPASSKLSGDAVP